MSLLINNLTVLIKKIHQMSLYRIQLNHILINMFCTGEHLCVQVNTFGKIGLKHNKYWYILKRINLNFPQDTSIQTKLCSLVKIFVYLQMFVIHWSSILLTPWEWPKNTTHKLRLSKVRVQHKWSNSQKVLPRNFYLTMGDR